ncbi:MATE family efflux transporter [Aestuariirhabdus litorea]|uniref:MATE family efflux transporter n=1 Tax=Aestuariirhabdus litorea TaxID=2528527 RepID=A0A3P3VQB2_9GAMM|nr:MATE family efflux transporter [Aestuariirhabdus litorea]RRJ84962.1 MATE family efflux transporter [Aestuariirhabdus litorea]RWW98186.1 MATE family efflux transporter [Endozoicomonadaceae bacterium GTF-13]
MVATNPFLTAPVAPLLRKLTLPMMGGIISLMLFYLLDAYFIAQLGIDELAVVGFSLPFATTLVNLAVGLGIGISATVARAQGANSSLPIADTGRNALLMATLILISISTLSLLFLDTFFSLLGAPDALLPLIHDYISLWLVGCTCQLILMNANAIFRATGNTRTPAKLMALGALLNALLDPCLIFGLGPLPALGLQGAAIASILAWSITLLLGIRLLVVDHRLVNWSLPKPGELARCWPGIMRIALPAALSNMMTPLAIAIITSVVAGFGPEAVAAFGVGERISGLALLAILALSMTLPPLVSQNLGAGNHQRIHQAIRGSHRFALVWQTGIYLILALAAPWIAPLFGDSPVTHHYIQLYLWCVLISLGPLGVTILTVSSLNALHQPGRAIAVSACRLFLLFIPLTWAGALAGGMPGLFVGAALANLLSAVVARAILQLDRLAAPAED